MRDPDFAPLEGLTFVARLPGAESLARYVDAAGAHHVVERRSLEATPKHIGEFQANDLDGAVLPVRDIRVLEGQAYLVYEGDAASTLAARVHDRSWGVEERVACLEAIAAGLRAIHARGLVHGDLTPDAILLRADGSVRFAALLAPAAPTSSMSAKPGEARTFGPTLNRIRATGGALAYLAPEQFMANTTLAESDVFAWGCVAYEVATGRSPFGFVTDPTKLLEAITRGPQSRVHAISPRFSEAFDAMVRATLAVERARRVLPSDFTGALLAAPAFEGGTLSRVSPRGGPTWLLAALVAAAACASLAYFALGR